MAIRLRQIDEYWIALCAVESNPKENDLYLDDAIHQALATKFSLDWNMGYEDPKLIELMKQEKVKDSKEEIEKWLTKMEEK